MNQQTNLEDHKPTASLADLELTTEQADETKAGTSGQGGGAGKVSLRDFSFRMKVYK